MNLKKIKILNNSLTVFQKNVFLMFKGTFFAQIASLIGGLLLAEFYGSSNYGKYAVFMSALPIFAVVNTLQLEYAIVLTKNKKDKNQIISFLLVLGALLSISSFVFLFFLKKLNINILNGNIFLPILGAFIFSNIKVFEYTLIANNRFSKLSKTSILTSFLTVLFQFIFIFISFNKGLIYGYLISSFFVFLYLLKLNSIHLTKINFFKVKNLLKENNTLLKYALPSNLINAIANNSVPILILFYFSLPESGAYFLTVKLLGAPLLFISNSIAKPYFKKATELHQNKSKNLLQFTKKIATTNFVLMLFSVIGVNLFIHFLLKFFLNENWPYLVEYSFYLSFLFLGKSLFSPVSYIIEILNKNHIGLLFNIYLVLATFISIYIGHIYNSSLKSIILMSIINGIGYFFIYFYFLILIKKQAPKNE